MRSPFEQARSTERQARPIGLGLGRGRPRREPARATVSPGRLAFVESIWRMKYVLTTLNQQQVLEARRENELNDIVAAARRVMAETTEDGPT